MRITKLLLAGVVAASAAAQSAAAQFERCSEGGLFVGAPSHALVLTQLQGGDGGGGMQERLAGIWCGEMETVEDTGVRYTMELRLPATGAGELEVAYVWYDRDDLQRIVQAIDVSVNAEGEIVLAGRDVRPLVGGAAYYPDSFRCTPRGRDRLECFIRDAAGDSGRASFDRAE